MRVSDTLTIDERDLEEHFVRASGPGGQNVNKVSTAVELRFKVGGSSLPEELKTRLVALAGRRMTADGVLVIEAREHRTQAGNREAARERLRALVERASRRPAPRRATRPPAAAAARRVDTKRHQGAKKRLRRGNERE